MTLPTRDEAQAVVDEFAKYGIVTGSKDAATSVELDCLSARANGELLSRAEWEATIDYEVEAVEVPSYEYFDGARAQVGVLYEVRATVLYPGRYAIVAVDAALGIGETP